MELINYIVGLGTTVMMPLIFLILALLVGVKPGKALKAALLIGIGFEGLNMVINLLLDNLGPAADGMVDRLGVSLTTLDAGWAEASTVGWGSSLMVPAVVMFLLINLVMIVLKLTSTVNIDIFNYWITLCEGAMVYEITKNAAATLIIMGLLFAFTLKFGDWTAEKIGREFQLEGISFPHLMAAPHILFGIVVDFIFDRIPGLKDLRVNADTIKEKFGVLGDSTTIGFILGLAMGLLAGYDAGNAAVLAMKVAAAMYLLPKMVGILVDGLNIVREVMEKRLKKAFPDRKFYIGMDVALLVGDSSIVSVGMLLIPITLVLAVLVPGNKVLPFVDLPSLIFLVTMMAAYCKKDMLRMLVAGTIMMAFVLFAASDVAGIYTQAAHAANAAFPEGIQEISALNVVFANPLGWLVLKIVQMIW